VHGAITFTQFYKQNVNFEGVVTYTLSLSIGESKGGECGEGKGSMAVPVFNRDSKWETEEGNTLWERELWIVLLREPDGNN